MATSAAQRRGLTPPLAQLDSPSFHGDGRSNRAEEPDTHVSHPTHGNSRDHRPDRNPVMLDLSVEHQAGSPLLMQPLSGNSSEAIDFRHVVTAHIAPRHSTHGTVDLVDDSALDNAENLQPLAHTPSKGITRVPATWSAAQAARAAADPAPLEPLMEGYRDHLLGATYGAVAQCWMRIDSAHRRPQVQRPVETQLLRQRAAAVKAFQQVSRTACACEADAQQA
jgi:transposase